MDYFPCVYVHRDDVATVLFPNSPHINKISKAFSKISDEAMQKLASKIGSIMLDGGDFWEAVKEHAMEIDEIKDLYNSINQ